MLRANVTHRPCPHGPGLCLAEHCPGVGLSPRSLPEAVPKVAPGSARGQPDLGSNLGGHLPWCKSVQAPPTLSLSFFVCKRGWLQLS